MERTISEIKLLIPKKSNIKLTCGETILQNSIRKLFTFSQTKNVSLEKGDKS